MANNMVSNNTDYSRTSETNKGKPDLNVSDVQAPTTSKRILLDRELDWLESGRFSPPESYRNRMNEASMGADPGYCNNLLKRLKGQKWQQFLDYEKVLKKIRCIEKLNLNSFDMVSYSGSNSKAASSLPGVAITAKSKYGTQKQKQVQRLNGNEMQYYGLAPKQKALETVICNVCNGIYTKVGFSNHMIQQHGTVWSNISERTAATEADAVTETTYNRGEEHMRKIEHMDLVGISSDSFATVSSTTSSSPSSSMVSSCFGNTTRATKVNRSSSCGGSVSTGGRFRPKANKQQPHLSISNTTTNVSISSPSTTATLVADLLLPHSRNLKSTGKKSAQTNVNSTATAALVPSTAVLPTFGSSSDSLSENNLAPLLRGSCSNLSNSSTSSSSTSSVSSKVFSKSAMSSPSLAAPIVTLPLPLTDVSNNITPQFEIVSSSTGYYLDSVAKEVKGTNLSVESYDNTDENSAVKNPSEIRDLTTTSLSASSFGVMPTVESLSNMIGVPDTADQVISNITPGSECTLPTPTLKFLSEENDETSANICNLKNDNSYASDSIISSSIDVIQSMSNLHQQDYNSKQSLINAEHSQLGTMSTHYLPSSIMQAKMNYNSKSPPPTTTKDLFNCKINPNVAYGVSTEYGTTAYARPSTSNIGLKRQVTGRNKPFNEISTYCCFDKDDADNSALNPQSTVELSNSSTGLNGDRQSLVGLLSATSNFSCAVRSDNVNLTQNNMSPPSITKIDSERGAYREDAQENSEIQPQIQSISNEKSKQIKHTTKHKNKTAASSNTLSDPHHQVENLCYPRCHNQNSSNENSIHALDGIFDNATLDVLNSKFITEILNNPQSDINFEDLEESSGQLCLQPATKRLRLDVNSLRKTRENSFTCFDQPQKKMLISENSDQMNQTSIRTCNTNEEDALEFQTKQIEMHYHTEINDVIQPTQYQIPEVEAMQFQTSIYQQCSLTSLGEFAERQDQTTLNCGISNSKEIIDLSGENLILENISTMPNLRNISAAVKKEVLENEFDIDNESSDKMEWRFKISTVPSLTDESSEAETIGRLQGLRRERYSLPLEDKLLLETGLQDQGPIIKHQEHIKNLLTQQSLTNLGQCNPYNTHNSYIRSKPSDAKYLGIEKGNDVYYDFSRLDTLDFLNLPSNAERKSKSGHKKFCDEFIFSINIFNSIPRPLTINNFAIIKFPLTQATVFRKVSLTSRKVNNQIAFSNSNAAIGNCINGYFVSGSSIQTRYNSGNIIKNNLNLSTSNNSAFSNDFSPESLNANSATFNSSYALLPKQHKIDPGEHIHRSSSYHNVNSTISGNIPMQGINRHHKSSIGNSLGSNSYGKHKSPINTVAPVAIVNPTARFSTLTQSYPNINHCDNNNLHNSQTSKTVYIHNSAMGTDRVKLTKRPTIAKLSTFKSTFITPKLITELIVANNFLAVDVFGAHNGSSENIGKSRFVTCYRKRRKRSIFKWSPKPVKIKNSTVRIVGEQKEKIR